MAFSDTAVSTMTRCKSAFFTGAMASAVSIAVFKSTFTQASPIQTQINTSARPPASGAEPGAFEPDKQHLRFNRIWMVANNESSASSLGQKSARLVGKGSFNHRAFHF
jgi:hypothetical protein